MPQGPVPRPPSQPLRYAGVPAAPNAPGLAAGRSAERGFTRPTTNVVMLGRRVLDLEGIDDKVSRDPKARKSKHLGTKVRRMIASYPLLPDANPVFCRELGEFRSITYGDDPEAESINLNVTMGYALDGAQRPGLQFIRSEVALGVTARLGPLEPLSFAIPAEAVPHFTTAT
jgi:hypothetical protein